MSRLVFFNRSHSGSLPNLRKSANFIHFIHPNHA